MSEIYRHLASSDVFQVLLIIVCLHLGSRLIIAIAIFIATAIVIAIATYLTHLLENTFQRFRFTSNGEFCHTEAFGRPTKFSHLVQQ